MNWYYLFPPISSAVAGLTAAFGLGLAIGIITARLAWRGRVKRTMASRYNNALVKANEANKYYSRRILALESQLNSRKCKISQISILLSKAVQEATIE